MSITAPAYCQECGRANGAAAKKCIWCGVPLIDQSAPMRFETTRVEIDYLGGIDRLDEPMAVKLTISADGIEISEIMPGSRSVKIEAEAIVGAQVVDASTRIEGGYAPRPWYWWVALGPLAVLTRRKKLPDIKQHDYLLTITYRQAGETQNAVFHREDKMGLSMVTGLAKIVTALVRLKGSKQ